MTLACETINPTALTSRLRATRIGRPRARGRRGVGANPLLCDECVGSGLRRGRLAGVAMDALNLRCGVRKTGPLTALMTGLRSHLGTQCCGFCDPSAYVAAESRRSMRPSATAKYVTHGSHYGRIRGNSTGPRSRCSALSEPAFHRDKARDRLRTIDGVEFAAGDFSVIRKWCPGTGSNRRHCDFQSHALPTELPGPPRLEPPGAARRRAYSQGSRSLSSPDSRSVASSETGTR